MNDKIKTAAIAGSALAVGIGGTAIADQLLTSRDIKDGSIKRKDLSANVKKKLDQVGEQGLQGLQGPQGEQGPRGVSTLLLGGRAQGSPIAPDPIIVSVLGGGGFGTTVPSEPSFQVAAPQGASSIDDLKVRFAAAPFNELTFTVRLGGVDSALSCKVTPPATTCDTGAASIPVAAGDLMSLGVTTAGVNGTKTSVTASFSLDLNLSG